MDDDQNYSVVSSFICKDIDQKKYRYLVEGKKEFNVLAELEDLPFTLKLNNSRRYICKPCLEKFKKTSHTHQETDGSRKCFVQSQFWCR